MQRRAAFREAALLSVIAMFSGLMLAGRRHWGGDASDDGRAWISFRGVVMALAIANGACALLLQVCDGWSLWSQTRGVQALE